MIPRTTVDIGNEELEAIKRVIDRKQFVKGPEAQALEEEFSRYQRVKFGATVNSGTSALHLSLLALGLKRKDEVILPPNTFAATVNAVILAGGIPVFADINPETYTIDSEKITEKITPSTRIILPVHLYGLMADMGAIRDIADEKGLLVLEDACQAHGAEYQGKRAGEIGDAAAFSFYPTKNATVGGDGGIVLSNNEELIEKIKSLRDHGRKNGQHVIAGFNNRMSELLAAVGRVHLKKLDEFNDHRRKIAKIYEKNLSEISQIQLPVEPKGYKHVYHLFTIQTSQRDQLKDYLKEHNIGSKIMYPERLNELKYVQEITEYQPMPVNDTVNPKILSLPISGTLALDQIEKVSQTIKEFFG
ncbi:MAG: DegT/DnrJ/EryC1/StrS family aminotransferase [Candidatus Heimdallarchaeaceae archaeon]